MDYGLSDGFQAYALSELSEEARARVLAMTWSGVSAWGGMVRGKFSEGRGWVTLRVTPWTEEESHEVLMKGFREGVRRAMPWVLSEPFCRLPYWPSVIPDVRCGCEEDPCLHGLGLAYRFFRRASLEPRQVFYLLNRKPTDSTPSRRLEWARNAKVPAQLGASSDRTRKDLQAVMERAVWALEDFRDGVFHELEGQP